MKKTVVINLLGGSGTGKSTTSCGLFYHMKLNNMHVELVREYVKQWAWEGRKVGEFDQSYIFGKQSRLESILYGTLDWIITDSPVLLSPIYEKFYNGGSSVIEPSALKFLEKAKEKNVVHLNFVLKRNKPFDTRGRYETAERAIEVDKYLEQYLKDNNIKYTNIDCPDTERVQEIINKSILMTQTFGAM